MPEVHKLYDGVTVYEGHTLDCLRRMPDRSVQCVVTSPPYYGPRDYEVPPVRWEAGGYSPMHDVALVTFPAWEGQLGQEPTIGMYVLHLVQVFREVQRVLRDDGILWLNMGDTYTRNGGDGKPGGTAKSGITRSGAQRRQTMCPDGLAPKNLIGIPWRVALALQADGWILRFSGIWHKPNGNAESVTDRPTRTHEDLFLLTKSERYLYDYAAIMEPCAVRAGAAASYKRTGSKREQAHPGQTTGTHRPDRGDTPQTGLRNHRGLFAVNAQGYPGSHTAVFPEELVLPLLLSGVSPQACPKCRAPLERQIEKVPVRLPGNSNTGRKIATDGQGGRTNDHIGYAYEWAPFEIVTTGWNPTCECSGNDGSGRCVVLDPFAGTGTVGAVAGDTGCDFVGCELNPDYVEMIRQRLPAPQQILAL